jgi:chromosome partitioning protein
VSENVLHAADVIVVPLIPTTLSVRTLEQLGDFVAEFNGRKPELLAFFSMVDRRKKLHREITEKLIVDRAEVADTVIPALSIIETMSVERAPVAVFAPNSAAAKAYRSLWAELRAFGSQP